MNKEEQLKMMGDRIKARRESLGLSQEALAFAAGYKSRSSINKIELGKNDIPQSTLKRIADALKTSPFELIGLPDQREIPDGYSPMPPMEQIPIIGTVACGTPINAEQNVTGYAGAPDIWQADFALICRGGSMEPKIQDGDIVAIRQQETVENGQIAAVVIDREATLKKVYFMPERNRLELRPINPDYETIILEGPEIESVRINGRAIGFCRALE